MGWQSYIVCYDTEEQKDTILGILKKHNSTPFSNEFVRWSPNEPFKRMETGEHLIQVATAPVKKPFSKNGSGFLKGPTLRNVVLFGNGGGRWSTFEFLKWELRRAFPRCEDVLIQEYPFTEALRKRLGEMTVIDQAVIGGSAASYIESDNYNVNPALYITRSIGSKRSREEEKDEAEANREFVSSTTVAGITYTVETHGFVCGDDVFLTRTEADDASEKKKLELRTRTILDRDYHRWVAVKYKSMRSEGKTEYKVWTKDTGCLSHHYQWMTEAEVEAFKAAHSDKSVTVTKNKIRLYGHDKSMTQEEMDEFLKDDVCVIDDRSFFYCSDASIDEYKCHVAAQAEEA